MSASLANAYMDSPKLDAILCEPCSYYSTTALKMVSEAISEHFILKISWGSMPQTHLVLHAYTENVSEEHRNYTTARCLYRGFHAFS